MADVSTPSAEMYCSTCGGSFANATRCPTDGTSLVKLAATDPLVGRELGGFTVRQRLGSGGMGTVYRALQHSVGREVGLKVIKSNLGTDPVVAKRFLREVKLAAGL